MSNAHRFIVFVTFAHEVPIDSEFFACLSVNQLAPMTFEDEAVSCEEHAERVVQQMLEELTGDDGSHINVRAVRADQEVTA